MQQIEFELDDEQRARVLDCLQNDGIRLAPLAEAEFLRDICLPRKRLRSPRQDR